MTAKEIVHAAEPHRKSIGTTSLLLGVTIFVALTVIFSMREHDFAHRDREQSAIHRERTANIEDRIRAAVIEDSRRPLVVYYVGDDTFGDERLITWPDAAVLLLGWTRKEMDALGLEILIPDRKKSGHRLKMVAALNRPEADQKTLVLHESALHKDGTLVPVRITVWALGGGTRSLAAYIDSEDSIEEL